MCPNFRWWKSKYPECFKGPPPTFALWTKFWPRHKTNLKQYWRTPCRSKLKTSNSRSLIGFRVGESVSDPESWVVTKLSWVPSILLSADWRPLILSPATAAVILKHCCLLCIKIWKCLRQVSSSPHTLLTVLKDVDNGSDSSDTEKWGKPSKKIRCNVCVRGVTCVLTRGGLRYRDIGKLLW